jgi:hypothetical protein
MNAALKASITFLKFCSRAVVNAMNNWPGIDNKVGLGDGAVGRDRKRALIEASSSWTKSLFRFVVGLRVDELVVSISLKLKIRYN